ncbi:porin [Parasedimentitalea huanghaiensis]|uniref:Porin n=1 Tax=Parasedimentitalea huanghaiensis TaxID=2682100 RepID=A0A6L6WG39_9RHOB|nr:porin [Zongyanglinia huanghaiensis]MVO16430.1 porin [Zongyanglinia huanghaiensis]
MKKILFASTALIATAGMAAADINFSGYGRFGISYEENAGTPGTATLNGSSDTIIVHRFRMNIDGSAETDSGVRFSARVRLQADEQTSDTAPTSRGEAGAAGLNGARFSVEYEGLRVDVGNVAGAIDNMPGYYGEEIGLEYFVGQYSAANYSFLGYSSGGAGSNGVYVRYAMGDFAVAASYDQASSASGTSTTALVGDRWDIHAAYTFGNITAALGYGETDTTVKQDILVLTLGGSWGAFSGNLIVGDESVNAAGVADATTSDTFYGISGTYDVSSATSIGFTYGDGSGTGDRQQYGIGVNHDLGGGVSLRGGIGNSKTGAGTSTTRADFGARFNF